MGETFLGLTGIHWAFLGAALAVIGGGMGSAMGITFAAKIANGVLAEEPEKFGKLLVIVALPGTQGIYGFITAVLVMVFFGLLGGDAKIELTRGIQAFLACLPVVFVCFISAVYQGLTSAAGVGLVAKRGEESGKAIIFPAMVETYAVISLIASILLLTVARPPA